MLFNRLIPADDDFYPYFVTNCCRLAGGDYLSRTFATSSRRKWVFATWLKRSRVTTTDPEVILSAYTDSNNRTHIAISENDQIAIYSLISNNQRINARTAAVFRDVTNWFHLIVSLDLDEAASADRVKMYINGVEFTVTEDTTTASGDYSEIGHSAPHYMGVWNTSGDSQFLGSLTETILLQGLSIQNGDVSVNDFGQFVGNVWTPKEIDYSIWSGYGAESFWFHYMGGTLGYNSITANPDWTVNNTPSYSADSPCRNYAQFHALDPISANVDIIGGGTYAHCSSTSSDLAVLTLYPYIGKYYFEVEWTWIGTTTGQRVQFVTDDGSLSVRYSDDGSTFDLTGSPTFATYGVNDVIGVALNLDDDEVTFYKNGVAQGTGAYSFDTVRNGKPLSLRIGNNHFTARLWAGQNGYRYTAPTGYVHLSTNHFPDPALKNLEKGFWNPLYVGNAPSDVNVLGSPFDLATSGLLWVKNRDSAIGRHNMVDHVRGWTKNVSPDRTDAEATAGRVQFVSGGFKASGTSTVANNAGNDHVAWCFNMLPKFGGDVVTYTGNGTAGRTVAHSLGAPPELIIVKCRSQAYRWYVGAKALGWTNTLFLDGNEVLSVNTCWNNTAPTSSVFSLGNADGVNKNGEDYVAYVFRSIPGFSKIGTHIGNGTSDNAFVFCDFRPRFLISHRYDVVVANWGMIDSARAPYNVIRAQLRSNLADAEVYADAYDFLSCGFKFRTVATANTNYIYFAIADQSFKYSNAR